MPASQAQIEANRKNAQKSTGPRTPEGKAKSAKNAMKHGFFSQDIIIKSKYHTENEQDYQELLDSLFDQFEPNGHFECYLVRTIANALWRQRRVVTAETAFINTKLNNIDHHLETESLLNKYLRKPDDLTTDPEKRQVVIDNLKGTSLVLEPKTSDTLLRI